MTRFPANIMAGKCRLALAGALLLAACAPGAPDRTPRGQAATPAVAGQGPTEYVMVDATAPEMPGWTLSIPDDADGVHYLVALSEHHASEQDARETAMKNARLQYAQYTGVEVSEVDEVIRSMYGASSSVLDPTVAGRNQTTQNTDAEVSRIKAKQWYRQTFHATRGGVSQGLVYKYYVLVSVPTDEIERVKQWRRSRQANKLQAEKRLEEQAERELSELLDGHRQKLQEIDRKQASGDLVTALVLIKAESDRLGRAVGQFESRGDVYARRAVTLSEAQKGTLERVDRLRSSLVIDVGHCSSVCILDSAKGYVIPVWVWTRNQGEVEAVSGLPLLLSDPAGKVVGRATTAATGKAEFRPLVLAPGRHRVTIDTSSGQLSTLDPGLIRGFEAVENSLQAVATASDFEGSIQNAVNQLFTGPGHLPPPVEKVILGPVTFATSREGSELALAIQRQLRLNITRISGLTVLEPKPRDAQVVAQAVTRGIALSSDQPAGKGGAAPSVGSPSIQAIIDGAEAALESTYTVNGDKVLLDLTLREAGTDRLLAATGVAIPKSAIPAGLQLMPLQVREEVVPLPEPAGGAIHLQVASHLGDGQTFQEGDVISWFVSADRDAYILLIYEDASRNLIQILPNRYSGDGHFPAGRFLQIPSARDRFEFTITGPFGREKIWAFASATPFPRLAAAELENGLYLLREDLPTIVRRLRSAGKAAGNYYGEAQAMITTVASR